jgi:hypothetical protein
MREHWPDALVLKLNDRTTRGIPDMLIIWRSYHIFVECKVGTNVVSPIQEIVMRRICNAGGVAVVARGVEEVEAAMVAARNLLEQELVHEDNIDDPEQAPPCEDLL